MKSIPTGWNRVGHPEGRRRRGVVSWDVSSVFGIGGKRERIRWWLGSCRSERTGV